MKVAIFEAETQEKRKFRSLLPKHDLVFYSEPLLDTSDFVDENTEIISVFIQSKVTSNVIKKFPKLKMITTRSTGYEHIDIKHAKTSKIIVSNVPHYGENTVAEHTFALILALSRQIHKSYVRTQQDNFIGADLVGFDLEGKTLGVIGTGNIGLHVIRIARGFGMKVLGFSRSRDKFLEELLSFKYIRSLDDLLSQSDIVSLHVPLTKETHHLINKENIYKIKKGAVIINTARGGIVDTEALYEALTSGHLKGAGLDVIEGEEFIQEDYALIAENKNPQTLRQIFRDKALFQLENVVFTPHIAFNSIEARLRIIETTAENIIRFEKGEVPNIVTA